jgi:hypothetical protein
MSTIILASVILGATLFMAFLETITRRCPQTAPPAAVPEDQRAGFYFRSIFNQGGILGFVFVPLLIGFLPMNSKILAEAFEVILDRAGYVIFETSLLGQSLEITDLHLYGFALGIAQILLGAELAERFKEKAPVRWFILFGAVLPVLFFEIFISALRGYYLAASEQNSYAYYPLVLAVTNALQAYICAMVELISGYRGVHLLLIPLIQAVFWTVVAPFRAIRRWAMSLPKREQRPATKGPGCLVRLGARVDEALFDPLRSIDSALGRLVHYPTWTRGER